jgi:hypothetical protein
LEAEKMNNYVKQLKEFKEYMNACFLVLMDYGDEFDVNEFYNAEFKITFRGKSVTLANGASVFQAIEEIVQNEIDEEEF